MGSPRRRCLWNAISLSLFPSSLSLSPVLWRIWRYESSLSSSFLGTVKQKSERGGVGARVAGTRAGVNIIAVPAHACTKIKYLRCAIHPRIFILSLLRREKTVHRHDRRTEGDHDAHLPAESWQICVLPTVKRRKKKEREGASSSSHRAFLWFLTRNMTARRPSARKKIFFVWESR